MKTTQLGKIISWNVNGLNEPKRRKIIYNWLKKQKCDVCYLQETHITLKYRKLLENKYLGEEFVSLDDKKRGVVTYVRKELRVESHYEI